MPELFYGTDDDGRKRTTSRQQVAERLDPSLLSKLEELAKLAPGHSAELHPAPSDTPEEDTGFWVCTEDAGDPEPPQG